MIKFIGLALVVNLKLNAQSTVTFNKTYNNGVDNFSNVLELTDGYLAVMTSGLPVIPRIIAILKTDFNGDTLWQKFYGSPVEYHINYALIRTFDGNFLTGAYNYNSVTGVYDIELMKFDSFGDSIWKKNVPPPRI
jgi:hypothetical protein